MKNLILEDIITPVASAAPTSAHIVHGLPIPAVKRIELFSPDDWEVFVQEWLHSLKSEYQSIKRLAGSGDQGRDVVGFCDDNYLHGIWDLFQCKYYAEKLNPSDIWIELGKLIYHTKEDRIEPPRKYRFMAPRGVGMKLHKILIDKEKIKSGLQENWDQHCRDKIAIGKVIDLEDDLLNYFESFDFSIFGWMTALDLIEGHSKTPFHATRFGGGLPPAPTNFSVPEQIQNVESRYISQLFEAYSDHKKEALTSSEHLEPHKELKSHFSRSRESFYSAELLRNFARDNVPPGTFESLQDDVYYGVVDTCDRDYHDGLDRLRNTIAKATDLPLANNPLHSAISPKNRGGICHQLANDDKLLWVQKENG